MHLFARSPNTSILMPSQTAIITSQIRHSGHSRWSKIRHAKGANDIARAKIFSKLSVQISNSIIAGKGETDPGFNMYLSSALAQSRAMQMPKANIETAIKKGVLAAFGKGGCAAEQQGQICVYEGMSAQHVAVITVALTANRNKSFNEIRHCFTKNNGSMGSVMFNFEKRSRIVFGNVIDAPQKTLEEMVNAALEMDGVEDIGEEIEGNVKDGSQTCVELFCSLENLLALQKQVIEQGFDVKEMEPAAYIPTNRIESLSESQIKDFEKLLSDLENQAEVVDVYHNAPT